ncbi:isochorismatase family protein [Pseudoalteromonas luteoviolacea]|uniref:isochorismatase family protein n=1 Tax=Pseudoalteromonas luteoviolacea TaxID=43657 RepID=UPI001F26CD78|nr:isochorismatase family protein [Pseudoalteromonas luteoviolacea]MCF6439640.1 isochorismatase family protein [Pseudoalteromonas luteoviolacea]
MHHTSEYQILVVDIQTRFQPHIQIYPELVNTTAKLLTAAELLSIPALIFEQYPKGLGHTDPALTQFQIECHEKTTFSALNDASAKEAISLDPAVTKIVVGIEAHVCVYQTVRDLLTLQQPVIVVADAIGSRDTQHKTWAIEQLRHDGAVIMSLESLLFDIVKDAKHPQFKSVSKLIR